MALGLIPGLGAVFKGGKVLSALGKIGKALKIFATAAATGGGVGLSYHLNQETSNRCNDLSAAVSKNSAKMTEILARNLDVRSCESHFEQFYLEDTADWCVTQYVLNSIPAGFAALELRGLSRPLQKLLTWKPKPGASASGASAEGSAKAASSTASAAGQAGAKVASETEKILNSNPESFQKMSDVAEALGLAPNATSKEVRDLIRRLLMKYHPEKNLGASPEEAYRNQQVTSKLNEIHKAWKKVSGEFHY